MRTRIVGAVLAMALATMTVTPVLADTTGGEPGDLGLDAIVVTGGSVAAKSGTVTVHGSVTCSQDITPFVWVDARQTVGRFHVLSGGGAAIVSCDAATGQASFDVRFQPDGGKFAPGKVQVKAYAEVDQCDDEDTCTGDFAEFGPATLRFRRH